jgi:hypothetical protein
MKYLQERRRVVIFAFIVMAITMVPYIVGFAAQGEDWRYSGFAIGVEDGNSYLAKMVSGAAGKWLFRSPHSAAVQAGSLTYLPYIVLGKLASRPAQHEQLIVLYHLARFVAGFVLIIVTYDFISLFIERTDLRWWGLILITLGGGLGWILVAISQKDFLGSLPLDFISPESFGFLEIFGFPHLAAARALLLAGLIQYLRREKGYLAGILWLVMGFFQPMIVVVAWTVIGSYILALLVGRYLGAGNEIGFDQAYIQKMLVKGFQAIMISAPIVIYTGYIFLFDPYFKAWSIQNQFPSPHIGHYLIAYGAVLPFAIAGIRKLCRSGLRESWLLAGWLVISPVMIYAPVITQRRLAEGLWAVLIIGTVGYFNDRKTIPLGLKGILILLLPSTLFIFLGSILRTANPSEPLFRNIQEVQAFDYLAEHAAGDAVVLSSFAVGNNLPAWVPVRVVMGHGPETIDLDRIQSIVNEYLDQSGNQGDCKEFFRNWNVTYLFWGPEESSQWGRNPKKLDCLVLKYEERNYALFEVEY